MEYKSIMCDFYESFDGQLNERAKDGWRIISSGFAPMNECMNNSWWAIMERSVEQCQK